MSAPVQLPAQVTASPPAQLPTAVLSRADMVVLGGQLGGIGMSDADIAAFIRLIEDTALAHATAAARATALATVGSIVAMVKQTHQAAALTIYNEIMARGVTGLISHQRCANIAYQVSQRNPIQQVPVVNVPTQ